MGTVWYYFCGTANILPYPRIPQKGVDETPMKSLIKKFFSTLFDATFWKYAIVGCVNTAVGAGIMFLLYNVFHVSYWPSAACNHIAGATTGYFLNKNWTFRNRTKDWRLTVKYIINIASCYLVGYGIAKPLMRRILSGAGKSIQENVAMATGLIIFIGMNYLNQRFYLYRKEEPEQVQEGKPDGPEDTEPEDGGN